MNIIFNGFLSLAIKRWFFATFCYKWTGSYLYFLVYFREAILSSADFREALLVYTLGITLNKREINFKYLFVVHSLAPQDGYIAITWITMTYYIP